MSDVSYMVRTFINGREGIRPSFFESLEEVREYVGELDDVSNDLTRNFITEFKLYEVREFFLPDDTTEEDVNEVL